MRLSFLNTKQDIILKTKRTEYPVQTHPNRIRICGEKFYLQPRSVEIRSINRTTDTSFIK